MSMLALFDTDMALEWAGMLARWVHVIAGICWIGSSFYFMALDAELKPNPRLDPRVKGEAWQVHGGGFYHMQKFTVVPEFMPKELTWFKWEAYSTWIFGFLLLCLTYFTHASTYLIDPEVADISPVLAVAMGAGSLALGWLVYTGLCRSPIGKDQGRLALAGFVLLVAIIYGYTHVFSGRGAFILIGALVGSVMVGNVFFIIMPNQRKTVAALMKGEVPDAAWGKEAKQRSTHNNYLTLPVVFIMLSGHYAITYQTRWAWIVISCVFVAGFLVRHWFNVHNAGGTPDWKLWPASAAFILVGLTLAVLGLKDVLPAYDPAAPKVEFAEVERIINERCRVCHVAPSAPQGVVFENARQIQALAPKIYLQAVKTRAMPLGNATQITDDERQTLRDWVAQGAPR
ncbi:MAG: urate hydroxylase PuuD [Acetobacteraceae bacterium]|nr:urate hydroxylase PuuD [Acetobacteraceae bacterium]